MSLFLVLVAGCSCTNMGDNCGGEPCTVVVVDSGVPEDTAVMLQGLELSPSSAVLTSRDGSNPTQTFDVIGVYSDGSTAPVTDALFGMASSTLGTIGMQDGVFRSNGIVGGSSVVTATVVRGGKLIEAEASVAVYVEHTLFGDGVPNQVETLFDGATSGDLSPTLLYPLHGAVMPQNVFAADVQWEEGVQNDLFHVSISKEYVRVDAYLTYEPARHWLADKDAWRSVAQTSPDDDAVFLLDRFVAAESKAFRSAPVHVHFAKAAITGSIYYWDIDRGRIVRINDGTNVRDEFMPAPQQNCVGCHQVSPSGRYMIGRHGGGDNVGTVYDLTLDLTATPAPSVFATREDNKWWGSTWAPDESAFAVVRGENQIGQANVLAVLDRVTGAELSVTGSPPRDLAHPAWSPDGTQIAYTGNINAWGGANTTGDVVVVDMASNTSFGSASLLHAGTSLQGSAEGGVADSYPSWSPDSDMIAFAHGTGSRSELEAGHKSQLYAMARDGSGVVQLGNASSSALDDFQPRFSPFNEGGYYWLSYLSRRPYGNDVAGTGTSKRNQIWITAIRNDAAPGEDPSSVSYWVPGRNTQSRNIAAFWAPRACRPDGDACSVGSECCGGVCNPDADGVLVCEPPPPDRCRVDGETCSTSSDCCDESSSCQDNVCASIIR